MEKENQNLSPQRQPVTVKGTSWLLDNLHENKEIPPQKQPHLVKVMGQSKKWKKNVSSRFEGYSKTIEKTIQTRFRKQIKNQKPFAFNYLRSSQSQINLRGLDQRLSVTFEQEQAKAKQSLFDLQRKEKDFEMQVAKIKKLKDITEIFEKKKLFYDNCIEEYFSNEATEINKTISKITHRTVRASRNHLKRL